jgi:tetratricopeptide (TPR) repeat protein
MKQDDIVALEAFLVEAQANPRIDITSISITGFASPEGEVAENGTLSQDRSKSAMEAVMKVAKSAANEEAQVEATYNASGSGEDFSGFESAVNASDMEQADKDLVIRVIKMEANPDQQEADAHDLAKLFKELDKEVFPSLRRAEISVNYDKTGFTDEELMALSNSNPDSLNLEELLFTATLYTDLNEKLRVYNAADARFGNEDPRVANNAGAALYQMNKVSDSKSKFEKANGVEDNAISKNNLGAVAGVDGDREKAMELLNQASGAGSEVSYNKGILHIQNANYDDAVNSFGSESTFNKGLAQLLAGSVGDGVSTIDGSDDAESAQGYYLKAVASAKQDNMDGTTSNLKKAIAADGSLKAKAARDREFVNYFENAAFTAIVQ